MKRGPGFLARAFSGLAILVVVFALAGCASSRQEANDLAETAGWQWTTLSEGAFDLREAAPPDLHGDILWVYLEGDGRAYLTPTRAAADPTPTDPLVLRLAISGASLRPSAYLARPCQYVLPDQGRGCHQEYWTQARYAPEVVQSTDLALDAIKAKAGASKLVLVGYSGGGALAVLVAARRHDVAGLITIAADLDLAYWTKRDGLSPLAGSLDPAEFAGAVGAIPQVHFTGGRDQVTGTDVVRAFAARLPAGAPVQIVEMPDFTHGCCWAEAWMGLLSRPEVAAILGSQR